MTADRRASETVSGARAAIDALAASGVEVVFGNPGTTELPLLRELVDDERLRYLFALHEGAAVSAAAGYALATRRPGVVLLHALPGLANGLSMYYNAFRSGIPLVVIAGTQDRRHQHLGPVLQADLVDLMRSVSKAVSEVQTADALGETVLRALRDASSPPRGPIFLSVPLDIWTEPAGSRVPVRDVQPPRLGPAAPEAIEEIATLLLGANAPILVAGDLVGWSDCGDALADLAELVGAPAYWAPTSSFANAPTGSPSYRGPIFPNGASYARAFAEADVAVAFGAELLPTIVFERRDLIPPSVRTALVAECPGDRVGVLAPEISAYGDIRTTLVQLLDELRPRLLEAEPAAGVTAERRARVLEEGRALRDRLRAGSAIPDDPTAPLPARAAVATMLAAVPSDAVIVDEAISNAGWIPLLGDFQRPDDFVALARGGSLGYGLGSAIGAHIGSGRPVLVVVGDGSLTYAPQGLWTIAHERLPIVTCVLNNGGYEILKQFARTHFDDGAEGRDGGDSDPLQASMLDIGAPSLDFAALARAWGVEAVRVGSASECRDAVAHAFATGRPWLIDVPVASSKG